MPFQDGRYSAASRRRTALERWEESLVSSSSLAQIFLHLTVLESSISWSKLALHARCHVCRKKGGGERMLLCDGCNRGHHMYCLKPPVKVELKLYFKVDLQIVDETALMSNSEVSFCRENCGYLHFEMSKWQQLIE